MMRENRLILVSALTLLALMAAPHRSIRAAPQEVLSNESILEMLKLGFSDELIIAKIRASAVDFDTSLKGLKALKDAGVSDEILAEMTLTVGEEKSVVFDVNDPLAPHEPGIYLYRETAEGIEMIEIQPSLSMQAKTGGMWKSALTYGVAKVKSRAILHGLHSQYRVRERKPLFYFYFGHQEGGFGGISPREFALVQMKVKQQKGSREIVVGTFSITGAQSGVMEKFAVGFESEEVAPGIHRIVPTHDLADGEYGFYYGGASPGPLSASFAPVGGEVKVFDFCRH